MRDEPIETFEVEGYTVEIHADGDPESPREWDNLGTMVCFHKRYDLGDKHDLKSSDFQSWDEIEAHLIRHEHAVVTLPLYLFDHSGITMRTYPFECPWDSGQVGWTYISREKVREEYGWKRLTKERLKKIEEYLVGEVETYDQYLTGDVYGYVVLDEEGEDIDSCWGYYGIEYARQEAESAARSAWKHRPVGNGEGI